MTDTLLSFAQSLGVSVKVLSGYFNRAGVSDIAESSTITNSDKNFLLEHLRSQSNKKQVNKKQVRPTWSSKIQRLIDKGYISKKRFRGVMSDADVLEPKVINDLALHAVRLAYGSDDPKFAQALIELLPRKFQRSLADWFEHLGIPCKRLAISLDGLPNSKWLVCTPKNKKQQSKMLKMMTDCPVVLVDNESASNNFYEKPWFDDLEISERGHSVKAYQGGATGLKR